MDHLVSTYCNISIVVAGICTTAMNWRFSYQLGTTVWDSYTWATFSVAFDVSKWLICCRSTIDALLAHDRSPGRKGARDPLRVLGTGVRGDLRPRVLRDHATVAKAPIQTRNGDPSEVEAADVARRMAAQ